MASVLMVESGKVIILCRTMENETPIKDQKIATHEAIIKALKERNAEK